VGPRQPGGDPPPRQIQRKWGGDGIFPSSCRTPLQALQCQKTPAEGDRVFLKEPVRVVLCGKERLGWTRVAPVLAPGRGGAAVRAARPGPPAVQHRSTPVQPLLHRFNPQIPSDSPVLFGSQLQNVGSGKDRWQHARGRAQQPWGLLLPSLAYKYEGRG
jgi:hypothetical protein